MAILWDVKFSNTPFNSRGNMYVGRKVKEAKQTVERMVISLILKGPNIIK